MNHLTLEGDWVLMRCAEHDEHQWAILESVQDASHSDKLVCPYCACDCCDFKAGTHQVVREAQEVTHEQ